MAADKSKKTKNAEAALEFLRTGEAPEVEVQEEESNLDEQLDELAEEQAEATESEEEQEGEAEEEAEEPEPQPEPKKKTSKKSEPEVVDEEEEGDADGNEADVDPNELPEEVANLPRVQALVQAEEQLNVVKDALLDGYANPYLTGESPDFMKAIGHLQLERKDAAVLYGILDGNIPASEFLSQIEKNKAFESVTEKIFSSLVDHLAGNGFIEWYIGQKGYKVVKSDADPMAAAADLKSGLNAAAKVDPTIKPLLDKIESLEKRLGGGPANAGAVDAEGLNVEERKYEDGFNGEIKRLLKEKNVPEEKFFQEYKKAIIAGVQSYPGGTKAIMDRIAKGNFVDVKRLFALHNNEMLSRAAAYKQGTTAPVKKIIKTPGNTGKTVTPAAKGTKKKAPMTAEQAKKARLDAGLKALKVAE